ncbi:MAG: hypothetical protein GXP54_08220, partial [Deltaproteobacteria bacterium]|nr:hypothetical protein [Deltaproteobacteria bacterium]
MTDRVLKRCLWTCIAGLAAIASCGSDGGTCVKDLEPCEGGVCLSGRCEPLEGDADFDGLLNGDEVALGTDPLNWDTDGDQRP